MVPMVSCSRSAVMHPRSRLWVRNAARSSLVIARQVPGSGLTIASKETYSSSPPFTALVLTGPTTSSEPVSLAILA